MESAPDLVKLQHFYSEYQKFEAMIFSYIKYKIHWTVLRDFKLIRLILNNNDINFRSILETWKIALPEIENLSIEQYGYCKYNKQIYVK